MLPSQAARSSRRENLGRANGVPRRIARWTFTVILGAAGVCAVWLLANRTPDAELPGEPEGKAPLVAAVSPAVAKVPRVTADLTPHSAPDRAAETPAKTMGRPEPAIAPVPEPASQPPVTVAAAPPAAQFSPAAGDLMQHDQNQPGANQPGANQPGANQPGANQHKLIQHGLALIAANRPIEARRACGSAMWSGSLSEIEAAEMRRTLSELNQRLIFSPEVVPGDPFAFNYLVQDGDSLARIARRLSLHVDWRFLQRINRMPDPGMLRAGRNIKIVPGPFHAIIDKPAMRMDLYMGEESDLVYVRSFPVGLGQFNSTPVGRFRVRPASKLVNPEWVNPRTRERFAADNPANPIGERWIGLEGTDEATSGLHRYGIHGTIEPDSIGREASMGCVRMLNEDVEIVYELLTEGISAVRIVGGNG